MGEIKHSFTAGKMNKDLDERLVPQGQYRDANNIQIRTTTSDGSDGIGDAGVIQNLQGNVRVGHATGDVADSNFEDADFFCIGSVGREKTDSAYFFFTTDKFINADYSSTTEIIKIDTIVEHNVSTSINTPVIVDRWGLQTPISTDASSDFYFWTAPPTGTIQNINVSSLLYGKVREGMTIEFTDSTNPDNFATVKIKRKATGVSTLRLYEEIDTTQATWANFTHARFTHPRALNFSKKRLINGINIIDNLLFWTDGVTEPKKINIDRCKEGTDTNGITHTKLFITNPNTEELEDAASLELTNLSSDLLEEHITVLRPAPKTPPTVKIEVRDDAELKFTLDEYYTTTTDEDGTINSSIFLSLFFDDEIIPGNTVLMGSGFEGDAETTYGIATPELSQVPLQPGDVLVVSQEDVEEGFATCTFKVKFVSYIGDLPDAAEVSIPTNLIKVEILTTPNVPVDSSMESWSLKVIDVEKSKFELKFPRFGYRYKYEDGEYSAFSPWSELAFDPGLFDYDPIKGYNLGMVNTIKKLTIKDFIPYYTERALDITDVEILYKSTDSANIYTIKSIKKIRDGEWELFTPDGALDVNNDTQDSLETGSLEITTESIYRTLPSNQLLRTFDNVPRYALAQEITGSRILYGNFVQGFDIKYPVGLDQNVVSETVNAQPKRSVKTIRDYKVGMVFGDKYGRETPVIASNKITDIGVDTTEYIAETDDVIVPKELCAMANKLSVKQVWDKPGMPGGDPSSMTWMEYVKYYVKETSNEYYNLVLDRWYDARDEGNIWLSFPSADRNKVDLETYLYLKKSHGTGEPVLEEARYKIIDIKAEAPDYIKTDTRNMGLVPLDGDAIGAQDPQINEPFNLTSATNTQIIVDSGDWSGFLSSYGDNLRGQLLVRVMGRTENPSTGGTFNQVVSGEFKKVTHHYVKPNSENGVVTYDSSFLGSADMVDRFGAAGFPINDEQVLKYYFEFREEVVENKPEFDGRFFVLIEKDEVTEASVEMTTGNQFAYSEIAQYDIAYVDTQQFNPAQQGPYSTIENAGDVDTFGATGIYNEFTIGEYTGGNDHILTDPTQPCEWWGFGKFSQTEPYDGFTMQNDTYDSRQIAYFALGCNASAYNVTTFDEDTGLNILTYEQQLIGSFDGESKTANYAGQTKFYWEHFKRFHTHYSNGWGDAGPEDSNLSVGTLVFLDGARANRYILQEFSTDIMNSDEQGTTDTTGNMFISNDSVAEGGIYSDTAPSIYNYKPTALDQGHASDGTLGRMVLSQISQGGADSGNGGWDSNLGDVDATGLYNYFAGPDAAGTYFKFLDDTSDLSDPEFPEGKPHIYKVITKDVTDPSISIPPQYTTNVKNFGDLSKHGINAQGTGNLDNKSRLISTNKKVQDNDNNEYNVNYGGENTDCVDADGNSGVNCFELQGTDFLNPSEEDEIAIGWSAFDIPVLRIGMFSNDGDNEAKSYKNQRRCGQCGNDEGTGGVSEGALCNRHSIRFEFRRVDPATNLATADGVDPELFDPRGWAKHDGTAGKIRIAILMPQTASGGEVVEIEEDRAVWETEPKEDVGLDLYYEATHALPLKLKEGNTLAYAPLKSKVSVERFNPVSGATEIDNLTSDDEGNSFSNIIVGGAEYLENDSIIKVISTNSDDNVVNHVDNIGIGDTILFEHSSGLQTRSVVEDYYVEPTGSNVTYVPQTAYTTTMSINNFFNITSLADTSMLSLTESMNITGDGIPPGIFVSWNGIIPTLSDYSWVTSDITALSVTIKAPTGYYKVDKDVYKYKVKLGWHNCYSFGNGVESDRIRDDFNAPTIDNGIKVSTTVDEYGKELRSSSLIFSGLYNATSSVNDLNEFNMGEKIIKDLNPDYGTIQALKTRDTNVVVFCEDRVLAVIANKEAVFLADGKPQLTATDRVLGQVSTFKGRYGISKSPESMASDQYRIYFTDSQRGAVLRLSQDGLTPISNVGMKNWFRENIIGATGYGIQLLGTFDGVNGEYNLSINNEKTVAFNEGSKGWVCFKSFKPDQGLSITGRYLTVKKGTIYEHYVDQFDDDGEVNNRNLFYGATTLSTDAESTLTVMFNDVPGQVKSFKAMNYEGSQARIDQDLADDNYYNIFASKKGWWVDDIKTDLQDGKITWFADKENKWFNKVCGVQTTLDNLDTKEFTVQGIGKPTIVELPDPPPTTNTLTIKNNTDND
jgi:hypothetical protein